MSLSEGAGMSCPYSRGIKGRRGTTPGETLAEAQQNVATPATPNNAPTSSDVPARKSSTGSDASVALDSTLSSSAALECPYATAARNAQGVTEALNGGSSTAEMHNKNDGDAAPATANTPSALLVLKQSAIAARDTQTALPKTVASQLAFSPSEVNWAFPWHMACDTSLRITSLGTCMAPRFNTLMEGTHLLSLIRVMRPAVQDCTFACLREICGRDTLLLVRDAHYRRHMGSLANIAGDGTDSESGDRGLYGDDDMSIDEVDTLDGGDAGAEHHSAGPDLSALPADVVQYLRKQGHGAARTPRQNSRRGSVAVPVHIERQQTEHLYLRGEFMLTGNGTGLVFLGVPSVASVDALQSLDVHLDDFPIHSNGRELLQNAAHQVATVHMAEEIAETRAELDQTMAELRMEQGKQAELLHSILPESIAAQLAQGIRPPARKHANVSVLFSDIVGFTTLSSNASPTEIMSMLDALFSRFDILCEKHNVYKLETIGDAYLVLSGLPHACEDHADRLAAFAVDMMAASREVNSPVTGMPLQIRVGLHTGSVVAGVAGTTRPRFCVFGDTVNVASRMESTSKPGHIQMSGEFRRELVDAPRFSFTSRGSIAVKGKGDIATFFLDGCSGPMSTALTAKCSSILSAEGLARVQREALDGPRQTGPSIGRAPMAFDVATVGSEAADVLEEPATTARSSGHHSDSALVDDVYVSHTDSDSGTYSRRSSAAAPSPIAAAVAMTSGSKDRVTAGRDAHSDYGGTTAATPRAASPVSCKSEGFNADVDDRRRASYRQRASVTAQASARARDQRSPETGSLAPPSHSETVSATGDTVRRGRARGHSRSAAPGGSDVSPVAAAQSPHVPAGAVFAATGSPPPAVAPTVFDINVTVLRAAGDEGGLALPLLALVPARLTLGQIKAELPDVAGARFFTDRSCKAALLLSMTLGELHTAMVERCTRKVTDHVFTLYAWTA